MKRAIIAIIGTAVLAVSGYAQSSIGGVRWELTELNGRRVSGSRAFIEFDEPAQRFSGNTGCNRMFGNYEREGTRFKAGEIGTTKMACVGKENAGQESAYLEALKNASRIRRDGESLELRGSGGLALKFKKAERSEPGQVAEMASKKWLLRRVNGKTVSLPGEAASLSFDSNKRSAHGFGGCNSFGGDYEVKGQKIKFIDVLQTLIGCRMELVTVEMEFMEGLRAVDRFEIRGNQLILFEGDKEVLVFEGISYP